MITVNGAQNGDWEVINSDGTVLATEKTNAAAWRAVERFELRAAGRISQLYQSDAATVVKKAIPNG